MKKVPFRVTLGLLIAIVLDTALQLSWKSAVSIMPGGDLSLQDLATIVTSPLFVGIVALMGLQLLNWMKVLGHADLSFAQPITSLSYISVLALSALYLNEKIGFAQAAGVGFILVGVWFISRTDHASADRDAL